MAGLSRKGRNFSSSQFSTILRIRREQVMGVMLGEAVDQRAGSMGIKSAASFQWGDAQNAMDYWAQKIPNRLLQLQGKTPSQS
jgi:hypothetical protein